jgi:hypothetical protein
MEAGHSVVFGPISLPAELLDHSNVQLLWRYYAVSGTSGSRAAIRLDDVLVIGQGTTEDGYEMWRMAAYPDPVDRADESVSGPLADGGTGISNLLRYAVGALSVNEAQERLPRMVWLDGKMGIAFGLNTGASDVAVRWWASEYVSELGEILWDFQYDPLPPQHSDLRILFDPESLTRDSAHRYYRMEVRLNP